MAHFEVVERFKNSAVDLIPRRATTTSAGYDMVCAEDIVIPSYSKMYNAMYQTAWDEEKEAISYLTLDEIAAITKECGAKPTLVSTGVKCYMDDNQYLQLQVRSSLPLKHWLVCANGVGRNIMPTKN